MSFNKIFEIGLYKTGTSSLGKAYELLGFKHMGWNADAYDKFIESNNYEDLIEIINNYDAFEDGPWHDCDYKILDKYFPNSKFIILERDDDEWIKSVEHHSSPLYNSNNIHEKYLEYGWIYDKKSQKEKMINYKKDKYNEIKEYFKYRNNDLLVMDIKEGWIPLCKFLNLNLPLFDFPVLNISKKKNKINKIFNIGIYTGHSLELIFRMLGFNHKSVTDELDYTFMKTRDVNILYDIIDKYDSFDGDPWREIDYETIDKKYPNSKFIFTYIDDVKWINNLEKIFSPNFNINNLPKYCLDTEWIYNKKNKIKNLIDYKNKKIIEINNYFHNKDNILYYDLNDGWYPLCKFMGFKLINIDFPF